MMKPIRDKDGYGLFRANAEGDGERLVIELDIERNEEWGDSITVYENGRDIGRWEYPDELYKYYEENETKIIIYGCNYEIEIDKSTMVKIDNITDRNQYLVESTCKKHNLDLKWEMARLFECNLRLKNMINKGYTKEDVIEIVKNILK